MEEPILTIRQPWASAILRASKTVENRSWRTGYRGGLWIHASKTLDRDALGDRRLRAVDDVELPVGVILGSVTLVDVVENARSRWAEQGSYHWLLADPRPLRSPRPFRGRVSLTWVDPVALGLR